MTSTILYKEYNILTLLEEYSHLLTCIIKKEILPFIICPLCLLDIGDKLEPYGDIYICTYCRELAGCPICNTLSETYGNLCNRCEHDQKFYWDDD